ncbi:2-C-methyl-D-erythritol 4-phosphate cytidylyltransferase [Algoriphagus sp. D3-2-R+10]|uniref:2-C-methyl-D-erythritol 4-phosphate cytidylyltransferase n=1 Tax=Algoriphagus aurantiacus TaxID=3103948 RepID=UPI002B3BE816|nr:2-C-methyl-D-erythritol 4-phosphate cytidylyltransferase [Algoriphagus sp. D3-2-R+10]MEB2777751.1 2-C-methyl-D-erythritol 4-phosphate cytidylyltransferase [Algoriphagus sp. D3-2-R+10]
MKKAAILVAGGRGTRMGGTIAKQYLPVAGQPVLMRTLSVFYRVDPSTDLILVLPENDFLYWKELCEEYKFTIPHRVIGGGNSRFQSVRNGLNALNSETKLVAIHDGVRPFVAETVISESFEVAERNGSAIAVIALKDSIRKLRDDGKSFYEERQYFRLVQTPQTFQVDKIKKAFAVTELQQFTDDATVYENQGWQVTLISGNPENIKITSPEDMSYAEFIAAKQLTDR